MTTSEFIPFAQVAEQIGALCGQGQSCTALLVSDDNRMAQVHVQAGEIALVLCRGRRGRDALALMRAMRNARLSVTPPAPMSGARSDLPTATVLAYLRGTLEQLPEGAAVAAAPQAPRPDAGAAAPAPAGNFLTQPLRQACQQLMTSYIGPMAEIVCAEYFDGATDARALARALTAELPERDQAKFKAEIATVLGLG